MTELEHYRREIDAIDQELTRLVEQRFEVAKKVAAYKRANDLPVLDASREDVVIQRNQHRLSDTGYASDIADFYTALLAISRKIQEKS